MRKFLSLSAQLVIILIVFGLSLELIGFTYSNFKHLLPELRKANSSADTSDRKMLLEQRYDAWKSTLSFSINPQAPVDLELRKEKGAYTDLGLKHKKSLWRSSGVLAPDIDDDFRLVGAVSGKEKWSVRYRTNSFGRRLTLQERKSQAELNVIFEGCSFTFGEGVTDDKTFPSRVGHYLPQVQTFNHGVQGSSPTIVLKLLIAKGETYLADIDDKPSIVIFNFIDDHVRRIIGSSVRLIQHPSILESDPYFAIENDSLEYKGSFSDDIWKRFHVYRFLGETQFFRAFGFEVPFVSGPELKLVAMVIKGIESELIKLRPDIKFYFAFYPGESFYREQLIPILEKEGIKILDYSMFNLTQKLGNQRDLGSDGHPSEIAHDLYAYLISQDLKELK